MTRCPLDSLSAAICLAGQSGEDQDAFAALVQDYTKLLIFAASTRSKSQTVNITIDTTQLSSSNELHMSDPNADAMAEALAMRIKLRFPAADIKVERRQSYVAVCVKRVFPNH
ncbi:hypothetical protein HKX48_004613 [Thoreauomyces humboldtii]|nr:hypothetical protein HKX48_004613 [Thoreauomyces humboldtii]